MIKFRFLLVAAASLCSTLFVSACMAPTESELPVPPGGPAIPSKFAGAWNFGFTGAYEGLATLEIGFGGQIDTTIVLRHTGIDHRFRLSGSVLSNGFLDGIIYRSESPYGSIRGNFNSFPATGTYATDDSLNGKWWAARRN